MRDTLASELVEEERDEVEEVEEREDDEETDDAEDREDIDETELREELTTDEETALVTELVEEVLEFVLLRDDSAEEAELAADDALIEAALELVCVLELASEDTLEPPTEEMVEAVLLLLAGSSAEETEGWNAPEPNVTMKVRTIPATTESCCERRGCMFVGVRRGQGSRINTFLVSKSTIWLSLASDRYKKEGRGVPLFCSRLKHSLRDPAAGSCDTASETCHSHAEQGSERQDARGHSQLPRTWHLAVQRRQRLLAV